MEKKKILIVDEDGFSRVCSAILETEGFGTRTVKNINTFFPELSQDDCAMIITSYPYGAFFLDNMKTSSIPVIILSDQINREIIDLLEHLNNSYCMIKPLDYRKFRTLVREVMDGEVNVHRGYNIV